MNSVEEYQNIIGLLKKALEFYADANNYVGNSEAFSNIGLDNGTQARFVLSKAKEQEELIEKMQSDYDKIIAGYEALQAMGDNADVQELMKFYKLLGDGNNNI